MVKPHSQLFSEPDRALLEASEYDPNLKPIYNPLSSILVWDDEMPLGVASEGHDTLSALWLARAFLYYGYELPGKLLNEEYLRATWNEAAASGLKWAGFHRLTLSEEDKQFYLSELQRDDPEGL